MARRHHSELAFPALTIEGGLLAPDFLNRIAHLQAEEQTETDYDIPRGLKLRDEIGRYWKIAENLWKDFSALRQRTDTDSHASTVEHFLEPFFRHVLGFTDLTRVGQITLQERVFPIGLSAGGGKIPLVVAGHNQPLDKPDTRFGDGSRRRSPFLLAQEYLNANPDTLWAIVSNGLTLRVLRNNPSLTRPAYIEADLEAIFNEGQYPDFTALWLLAHATRFGRSTAAPDDAPLERWRNTAQEDGVRVRERLSDGVTQALRALGTGFLAHPSNTALRGRIESGTLSAQAYFEQLLRLVYRLIFLATIEDRELIFASDADHTVQTRYREGYSLRRLRELASRRRSHDRHADLWQSLLITFGGLGAGQPALGLPALGGLFDISQCADLDAAQLDNAALLSALYSLCFFRDGAVLSRVNYRDMDSEELGSVYESLLELVPQLTLSGGSRQFGFIGDDVEASTRGNARKLSGSYYTPSSLVQELIKSALEPVIERTLAENPQQPVEALLSLSVCDPACGSGHFLLAAARRIAEEVARLSATEGNPLPSDYRTALRDVVSRCIYGVDKNPMAVELARMALWLEAYTPERPLSFLDSHLRCGDALLGVLDPAILDSGIPDKAFNALSGDDKEVVKNLKKTNREALKAIARAESPGGQVVLPLEVEAEIAQIEHLPDDTLEAIDAKRAAWEAVQTRVAATKARLAADLFVAAFVLPKTADIEAQIPTSQDLWLVQNGSEPRPGVAAVAHTAAEDAQAFHWWQEFPQIHANGGFDVLLGNPPWERIKLQEEEFFATRSPLVAQAPHKAERGRRIALLTDGMLLHSVSPELAAAQGLTPPNPAEQALYTEFTTAKRQAEASSLFAHDAGRYPLTGVGDVNTYALFAETFSQLMSDQGRAGIIVPTGIATDDSTKAFFSAHAQSGRLVSLYDIENREGVFPSVHRSYKFCLLTLGEAEAAEFVCFITQVSQLNDDRRRFKLSRDDFELINPNTLTCPIFRSGSDAEISKKIYRLTPVLINKEESSGNPWGIKLRRMFDKSIHSKSGELQPFEELSGNDNSNNEWLAVHEGDYGHQYDYRYKTFDKNELRTLTEDELRNPGFLPNFETAVKVDAYAQYMERWNISTDVSAFLGFRRVARSTDERTVISTILPPMPSTYGWILTIQPSSRGQALLCANYNSLVLDYCLRNSLSQPSIPQVVFEQLPVIPPNKYNNENEEYIINRVLQLTFTSNHLEQWARELDYQGAPFTWNPECRAQLRAELDAYYARLYELTRDELRYILDPTAVMGDDFPSETFKALKNSEMRAFGEYRTQRLVLEAWDKLESGELH